jgi:ATP-dependent helicase Lhr and Lhr-like helicase
MIPFFQFHSATARWFQNQFGTPTPPQQQGWPAIQSGRHTLIAAPTGSGKTLAAFLASLDGLFRESLEGGLPEETRVVYVSPLKALSNDVHKNLEEPLAGIRAAFLEQGHGPVQVRAAVRTGDTSASQRLALAKKPPHILVTTPESFYLLLTSDSGRRNLRQVRALIVDEIHALAGNRRGSHLALSMERLAALTGQPLQRIGLSATQKPIEEVARFLVGQAALDSAGKPDCAIIDAGHGRKMDLALELPKSPLEAVMAQEVWEEIYTRLTDLIAQHRTTLVFVNTRRMAERVTHHLSSRLGEDKVTSHHGSLSAKLRLDAENRLKKGELKALVATASLELGIDIGAVDLVCQLGSTRSISTFLQRAGRAEHKRGGLPKGRIFPLSRDELAECAALLRSVQEGELDSLTIPEKPFDILAQQIVAATAGEDWEEEKLFACFRSAYPYRNLARGEFDDVVRMLAEGFSTRRGRRGALVHHDGVNGRIRARRGAGLIALTSGGAIPENADYRVVLEPSETFIGTVNEDFAIESMAGDIFQLGNASWKILQVQSGQVRVQDAQGQPPTIPFWLGEAPGRTAELSKAVSDLRIGLERCFVDGQDAAAWIMENTGIAPAAGGRMAEYFEAVYKALGVIPSQKKLVLERFFDESGGMQLVLHAPFGSRMNRAWGLALRKRFCRSFNFELQAAATEDAIILSLGTQHSFPLEEVFRYLHSGSVREVLVQALLDAPMFPIRWRWNCTRSLAVPRLRGARKNPAPIQRMEAENLLAAVFPDQLACLEHIIGDREIPEHPLVRQTIEDCLVEAMDIDSLVQVLKEIEEGKIECIARDLPEPSPLSHEILTAKPYAFLDDAPLEERRTQAVYARRTLDSSSDAGLGILDLAAIQRVCLETWPAPAHADELHDSLLQLGVLTETEMTQMDRSHLDVLLETRRASLLTTAPEKEPRRFWSAAEKIPMLESIYPEGTFEPKLIAPERDRKKLWDRSEALRELVRGRMEVSGPMTGKALAELFGLAYEEIEGALLALEVEGFVLRGRFYPDAKELEWCDRRLLARIHKLTLNRLRAEIQPVTIADFHRFLSKWQHVDAATRVEGLDGVAAVLGCLDGFEAPACSWEPDLLAVRIKDYAPQFLDRFCFTGKIGWGRFTPPQAQNRRMASPLRSSPVAIFMRDHLGHWLELRAAQPALELAPDTLLVLETLQTRGALFFHEITSQTRLLPSLAERALGELAALGWVTSDSFEGLRAFMVPSRKRPSLAGETAGRRHKTLTSVEFAGRWALLKSPPDLKRLPRNGPAIGPEISNQALETVARVLLRRYGVVFRRLLERESMPLSWYELGRCYRRLEARGEIRGGHFVTGVSGEQFALPEAIGLLRSVRKQPLTQQLVSISATDPLNLAGILSPGPRISALAGNRVLLQDGIPIAGLESGKIVCLNRETGTAEVLIESSLKIGKLPPSLRPYYG